MHNQGLGFAHWITRHPLYITFQQFSVSYINNQDAPTHNLQVLLIRPLYNNNNDKIIWAYSIGG